MNRLNKLNHSISSVPQASVHLSNLLITSINCNIWQAIFNPSSLYNGKKNRFLCQTLDNVRHIFNVHNELFIIFVINHNPNSLPETYWIIDKLTNNYTRVDWLYSADASGLQRRLVGVEWDTTSNGDEQSKIIVIHDPSKAEALRMTGKKQQIFHITTYEYDTDSGLLFFIESKFKNDYQTLLNEKYGDISNIYQPINNVKIFKFYNTEQYIVLRDNKISNEKGNVQKTNDIILNGIFLYQNRFYIYSDSDTIYNTTNEDDFHLKKSSSSNTYKYDDFFKCYGEPKINMKFVYLMLGQILMVILMIIINIICLCLVTNWRRPMNKKQLDKIRVNSMDITGSLSTTDTTTATKQTNQTKQTNNRNRLQALSASFTTSFKAYPKYIKKTMVFDGGAVAVFDGDNRLSLLSKMMIISSSLANCCIILRCCLRLSKNCFRDCFQFGILSSTLSWEIG
ncbi:hypothetical protein DERP_003421 [Dermatophagoides pteronyssinus]|uniref:Uncharacterized protein n=1 Tax=Dermatophagoides pteronyssinus TaxID=6956 RepID=A0ABQ8JK84_DERPT|nr:hypothetical protein DERP_003421 [Dermatophagoides pteronyssinus]